MPDAVMIFAAGFGTRMGALTQNTPKPLLHVAGKTLIDHTLDLVRATSPRVTVANIHYLREQLAAHLDASEVTTITEKPAILDTGGGLKNALPLLGAGPVFTTNSDAIWTGPNPFEALRTAWDPDRMDGLLMTVPVENAISRLGVGDFMHGVDGQLRRGPDTVYGGVQILKTSLLHTINEPVFSLNLVWDIMIAQGRLYGLQHAGKWCDVGHPDGITAAERLLLNHV